MPITLFHVHFSVLFLSFSNGQKDEKGTKYIEHK